MRFSNATLGCDAGLGRCADALAPRVGGDRGWPTHWQLAAWRFRKEGNIRALLPALDQILWPELEWTPISMAELVTPQQVKIRYMKAINKVHPDKVPTPPHPLARARSQSRARTDTGRGAAGRDGAGAHGRWRRRRCSTKCWPRASSTPSTKRSTPSSSKTACEKALFTSTVAPRTLCPPPSSFCSRCFFVRLQTHRPACTQQNLL